MRLRKSRYDKPYFDPPKDGKPRAKRRESLTLESLYPCGDLTPAECSVMARRLFSEAETRFKESKISREIKKYGTIQKRADSLHEKLDDAKTKMLVALEKATESLSKRGLDRLIKDLHFPPAHLVSCSRCSGIRECEKCVMDITQYLRRYPELDAKTKAQVSEFNTLFKKYAALKERCQEIDDESRNARKIVQDEDWEDEIDLR
jgi:phage regulator Rha-like protein